MEALAMIRAFGGDPVLLDALSLPIPAAELQGLLLSGGAPEIGAAA